MTVPLQSLLVFSDNAGLVLAERMVDLSSVQESPIVMKSWKSVIDDNLPSKGFHCTALASIIGEHSRLLREQTGISSGAISAVFPNLKKDVADFFAEAVRRGVDLFFMDEEWTALEKMLEKWEARSTAKQET